MAIYEYESCNTGKRREVMASMSAPPPEHITFGPGENNWVPWSPAQVPGGYDSSLDYHTEVWRRVYGAGLNVSVPDYAVKYGKAPASRSLPRRRGGKLDRLNGHAVMRHSDGGYTTLDGRPIIQNKADAQREQGRTGYKRA